MIDAERLAALQRTQALLIAEHGQMVMGVFPAADDPDPVTGFHYTIGNAEKGLPELLMIGNFPPRLAQPVLNQIGAMMRDTRKAPPEGLLDLGEPYLVPFKVRKAGPAAREDYTIQATSRVAGADYEVLQIMLVDPAGKWPGEDGCHPDFDVVMP